MNEVKQVNRLVTNPENYSLEFSKETKREESNLEELGAFLLSVITYPLFLVGSTLILTFSIGSYAKLCWDQRKIKKIFLNDSKVEELASKSEEHFENKFYKTLCKTFFLIDKTIKKPEEFPELLQEKEGFFKELFSTNVKLRGVTMTKLQYNRCKSFKPSEFCKIDFSKDNEKFKKFDETVLRRLQKYQIQLKVINEQWSFFQNTNESKTDAVKTILQMSYLKKTFKKQTAKEMIAHSLYWLLPAGVYFDLTYSNIDPLKTFKDKKEFLPKEMGLDEYNDIIEAHNALIRKENAPVAPYIKLAKTIMNVLEAKSAGFFGKEYVLEVKDSKDTDSKIAFVKHNVFQRIFSCFIDYFSGVAGKGVGDLEEKDIIRIIKKLNDSPDDPVSLENIKNVSDQICIVQEKAMDNKAQEQVSAYSNDQDINNNPHDKKFFEQLIDVFKESYNDKNNKVEFSFDVDSELYLGSFNEESKDKFDRILNYMLLNKKIISYYGGNNKIYTIGKLNPEMSTCAEDVFKQFIDSFKK